MTVVLVVVAVCVLAAAVVVYVRRPESVMKSRVRRRAIVTLKGGDAFGGILYAADRDAVVLREAAALGVGDRGSNVVVDGEVLILRGDISYVQLP